MQLSKTVEGIVTATYRGYVFVVTQEALQDAQSQYGIDLLKFVERALDNMPPATAGKEKIHLSFDRQISDDRFESTVSIRIKPVEMIKE